MLEKKLLTLASAAAIPACGACFLPPPPLPPPVRSALQSIYRIRVTAKNDSATHHLDPGDLAGQIARAINQQSRKSGARAIVDNAGGDADAVLEIIVENENVEQDLPATPAAIRKTTFFIKDSATLARLGGEVIWRETETGHRIVSDLANENSGAPWMERDVVNSLDWTLSDRLVFRLFYVR